MDYKSFDTRNYPTLPAQAGYQEWSDTYENSVEDEMDIRLLNRIDGIDWQTIHEAVDLACGTGRIGVWLKHKGIDAVDGVDFTEGMLSKAREKGIYRQLLPRNILDTQLASETYDLSVEVLADEHFSDLRPLYDEAARITKNGGFFIIVGYHPHFLMNGLVTHFHRADGEAIAIESYVHLFSDHFKAGKTAGLTLLEVEEGIVDADWLVKKPKWRQYENHPVSYMFIWKKIIL